MASGEPDLLYTVRANFYIGAYQAAIAEASDLDDLSEAASIERNCFVYRSYIELGSYDLVIKEVSATSPQALVAVKLLAQYKSGQLSKEAVLEKVAEWVADPACASNATTLLVAGTILFLEDNYVEALKACHSGLSLEMMALCVQIYLSIDRLEQAQKQLTAMTQADDDAVLTQLATAWINLARGGPKLAEAAEIFNELGQKLSWTTRLLTGAAAAAMRMGDWQEADQKLKDAVKKDGRSGDALANVWLNSIHTGKETSRNFSNFKSLAPTHPLAAKYEAASTAFDAAAAAITASA